MGRSVSAPRCPAERLDCDVLVIGGGLAGLSAALSALRAGARVTVVSKGFAGADGVSPFAGGVALYLLPSDDAEGFLDEHERAVEGLIHREAVLRVAEESARLWRQLADLGAPLPRDPDGGLRRRWLRVGSRTHVPRLALDSVGLLRFLRRAARQAGARVVDHACVTALLRSPCGSAAGAAGFLRQDGTVFAVRARTVVLAAGGCAWRGAHMGVHSAMGEAYGLAALAGAELASMEFCVSYIATCSLFDSHGQCVLAALGGRFRNSLGENILERHGEPDPAPTQRLALAMLTELCEGRGPVYFDLRGIGPEQRRRWEQDFPLVAKGLSRTGVDVFREPVPWIPGFTGSIGGGGGVRVLSLAGDTGVPGLFAAGDAACRTPVVGAGSGLTYLNLSWALASGHWAGAAAARLARERDPAPPREADVAAAWEAALAPLHRGRGPEPVRLLKALQRRVVDPERNFFRTRRTLAELSASAQELWVQAQEARAQDWHDLVRCHEVRHAVLTAAAMFAAAQAREETRGWHRRLDFPQRDDARWQRWTVARLDPRAGAPGFHVQALDFRDPAAFRSHPPALPGGAAPALEARPRSLAGGGERP